MKIISVRPVFSGHNVYAVVTTDENITGVGEGTLNSREAAVAEVIKSIEPVITGQDPQNVEHIWQDIHRGTFWRGGPVLMSALSAVDVALWDIKGKIMNQPVYNLLGGKCREKLRVYSHTGGNTPDELCKNAEKVLAKGITALRICPHDGLAEGYYEPGQQVRRSVKYMKALRQAVGEDVDIIFECHTRFTPVRAIEICNAVAPYNPLFVEDPIRSDSPESFRAVRSHTNVALGTGEKFGPVWDYKTLIEEDLIDYLRTDICNCGGITSMKKIAAYGEAHYIEMVPHGLPSEVGMMAVFHMDSAIPNFFMQESGLFGKTSEHLEVDAVFKDGFMYVGNEPGLGVKLDESKCKPFSSYEHPHWRREDGTVQDW
jgi:L-alanine-DL-glutamate epimerase-like enolase superfamily enzyme